MYMQTIYIYVNSEVNIMDSIENVSIKHKFMLEILMFGYFFVDAFFSFLDLQSNWTPSAHSLICKAAGLLGMESHKGPVAVDVFPEQVGPSHVR